MKPHFPLPLNLTQWIHNNEINLKPPVNNKVIWKNREFIVMAIGGPNERKDYHMNEGEEFFYQLKGDIILRIMGEKGPYDLPIKEGEIFLLPPLIPHSPQRPSQSLGLVIERKRREKEKDGFLWYCKKCHNKLYEEFITLRNIEKDLPKVFENFYSNTSHHTCKKCNAKHNV